jgi:hypothetical protein
MYVVKRGMLVVEIKCALAGFAAHFSARPPAT